MLMAVPIDLERLVSRRAPWRKPFPTFGEVKRLKGVGPRRVPLRCYRPTARRPSLTGAGRETQRKDYSPNNLPYPHHGPTAARGFPIGGLGAAVGPWCRGAVVLWCSPDRWVSEALGGGR
jgi:hypothetical protein